VANTQQFITKLIDGANPLIEATVQQKGSVGAIAVGIIDGSGDQITQFGQSATSVGSGQQNVTTAGTRVQLSSNACKGISIKAKVTNLGYIYVGGSGVTSSNGLILSAGAAMSLTISNTNLIYIDSSISGEGISYIYVN
jgi:hypothetical protein